MSRLARVLPVLMQLTSATLEAELGEEIPLLLLAQNGEGVHVCSNMAEEDRIEALEELLDEWKAERERAKRPPAAVLRAPPRLQ